MVCFALLNLFRVLVYVLLIRCWSNSQVLWFKMLVLVPLVVAMLLGSTHTAGETFSLHFATMQQVVSIFARFGKKKKNLFLMCTIAFTLSTVPSDVGSSLKRLLRPQVICDGNGNGFQQF